MKRWRLLPKVRFINYRREFPNMGPSVFSEWFTIDKKWSGRLIFIHVKAFAVCLDFRRDPVADMMNAHARMT